MGHYRQIIQAMKRRVLQVCQRRLKPRMVVCDFEIAIIKATQTELPTTRVKCCYFHYTQSLWRKVQSLGLSGNLYFMFFNFNFDVDQR